MHASNYIETVRSRKPRPRVSNNSRYHNVVMFPTCDKSLLILRKHCPAPRRCLCAATSEWQGRVFIARPLTALPTGPTSISTRLPDGHFISSVYHQSSSLGAEDKRTQFIIVVRFSIFLLLFTYFLSYLHIRHSPIHYFDTRALIHPFH